MSSMFNNGSSKKVIDKNEGKYHKNPIQKLEEQTKKGKKNKKTKRQKDKKTKKTKQTKTDKIC